MRICKKITAGLAALFFAAGLSLCLSAFASAALLPDSPPPSSSPAPAPAPSPPAYAKWGLLAVKEAQSRYNAAVLDYLHIGRFPVSSTADEERFKLWLRSQGREFGVNVYITIDKQSEQLISIRFEELP